MRRRAFWIGLILAIVSAPIPIAGQPFATQIQLAINQLTTGITTFTRVRLNASRYINWGTGTDDLGYGLRDSAGQIQVKDSGGAWTPVISAGGASSAASFITRVAEAGLTNETALASLATALLVNTTGTGVPTAYAGTTCTNQFTRALSAIGAATCNSVSLSLDVTGTLPVANGGTGIASGTSGGVLGFTAAGTLASSIALTTNAIVLGGGAGATPTALGSLGTTTTLLHGNAAGAPTFGAVVLTTDVSGILAGANGGTGNGFFAVSGPATSLKTFTFPNASTTILTTNAAVSAVQGGTGLTTYAVGDLLQANTTTTLARLAAVSTGNALISGGVGVISSWGKIGLTTHVSGTLPATNGGTGQTAYTTGDLLYANSGTTIAGLADVAVNSFLRSTGVGVAPAYSTTKWTNAATTGDLLAASAANTYSNITAVASGQVLASAGVTTLPVWTASPTVTSLTSPTVVSTTSVTTPIVGDVASAFRARTSLAVPGSLADGDWWVECTGVSPARVCAIKVRDAGATRTIAAITY